MTMHGSGPGGETWASIGNHVMLPRVIEESTRIDHGAYISQRFERVGLSGGFYFDLTGIEID